MKHKLTLPHSQDAIEDAEREVERAKGRLAVAENRLAVLKGDNNRAQRQHDLAKARVMTPTMRKALEFMVQGNKLIRYRLSHYYWNKLFGKRLNSTVARRLFDAEFLSANGSAYEINDAGRDAIK